LACQALFLQVPEHHFGTRPRDGTDTAFPHHPHATLWSGRRWDVVGSDVFFGSLCIARSPSSSTALHHHNDMSAPQCRRCVELEGRNCREGASCGRGEGDGGEQKVGTCGARTKVGAGDESGGLGVEDGVRDGLRRSGCSCAASRPRPTSGTARVAHAPRALFRHTK